MSKHQALFLDKASLSPADLDFSSLQEVADWQWFDNAIVSDIQHCLHNVQIIVSNKILIDRPLIENCEQLKLICVAATGVNNIDIAAAKEHSITVCNVRAYATSSVVQHVFSLLLSLSKKTFAYQQAVNRGDWSRSDFFCYFDKPIKDLEGNVIGIIGFGELGQAVAKIAEGFGMKVLVAKRDASDTRAERVDLSELLAVADVVTLHCPLTDSNRHIIDASALALMKPDAILINTARGGLVDEQALLQALKNNKIGAAGLDVLEQEPPSSNHSLIAYQEDNLIITPHVAWASRQSRQRLVDELAKNISAYQQGQARNIV